MPYSLFYRRRPLRMISYAVSPYSELARWVMDRRGVEYREESHVPMLHFLLVQKTDELPGLVVPEKMLANAREVLDYWEARSPRSEKLNPPDTPDVEASFTRFYSKTGLAVRRFAYYYMLPDRRGTLACWHRGAPLWEKIVSSLFFPVMRGLMSTAIQLTPAAPQESLVEIDDCFATVGQRLADGRRYLCGDQLSAADIAFASLTAPVLFPDGYAGPLPTIDELPPAMRDQVLRLRETTAGRFALRLYREDRPTPTQQETMPPGGLGAFFGRLVSVITGNPRVLRFAFAVLRQFRPILILGKTAVVACHADVLNVLERDREFTIAEINEARMDRAHAPFILGWDRSPRYDREAGILRRAMGPTDLVTLRAIVAREAQRLLECAGREGRIDIVSGLTRVVPTRVVSEFFGTPGPNEQTMMRWLRVLFYDVFLNRSDDSVVRQSAAAAADQLQNYLVELIAHRKAELAAGKNSRDDMLTRLLRMQSEPGDSLDDDGIRRNLSGIIVGAVDTTSAALAQAIDQILNRPRELALVTAAAKSGDVETVSKYVFEALRFNPQAPGILRFCKDGAVVGPGTPRETKVPPGATVVLGTLSGMFDPDAFKDPGSFRVDRDSPVYLHFGHGMHTCYGRPINLVQIPEIAMALFRFDGLRRASGAPGRIVYDGPFPDRLVVEFDPVANSSGA
jgi:cytochrome P450/glutathione S-transferase